jgi:hypothetical protein
VELHPPMSTAPISRSFVILHAHEPTFRQLGFLDYVVASRFDQSAIPLLLFSLVIVICGTRTSNPLREVHRAACPSSIRNACRPSVPCASLHPVVSLQ